MADWLSKEDLQDFVDTLPPDAVLCPHCRSRMYAMEGDDGLYYACRNEMCLNEEDIPVKTVMQAQS